MGELTHLAFPLKRREVCDRILIPKYYDPEIEQCIRLAEADDYEIRTLRDLLETGDAGSRLGVWIPRENYGTGAIPYVRTSDLSQWRIRPDFKKGVAEEIFDSVSARIDVRPHDLLMVAHGTYLVGTVAIVQPGEEKLVLQDHVFRLRCRPGTGVDPLLLLALLSTSFVKRQVRSRQFSADIIDKIGNRHLELRLAVPRSVEVRKEIVTRVSEILDSQSAVQSKKRSAINSDLRMRRERAEARYGFHVKRERVVRRILIPKYYDPTLEHDLQAAQEQCEFPWTTLGDAIQTGQLQLSTGVEVGKMAYGTGPIPFIRTSDLVGWEVKLDVRQGISEQIYDQFKAKAALREGDVLLVRDGTYLVGSSAYVGKAGLPALICGGLFRLRCNPESAMSPLMLLGMLNLPLIRRQMRAKQFTRDVIDTLGNRALEVQVPSPKETFSKTLEQNVKAIVEEQHRLKIAINNVMDSLEPPSPPRSHLRPAWSMR